MGQHTGCDAIRELSNCKENPSQTCSKFFAVGLAISRLDVQAHCIKNDVLCIKYVNLRVDRIIVNTVHPLDGGKASERFQSDV